MHKYAAATTLVIALNITMLTPAVSGNRWCRGHENSSCACAVQCNTELWNTAKLWDRTSFVHSKPLRDACVAKCVAVKLATQH
jgi:hypothetical protein